MDAGKPRPHLVLGAFSRALLAVSEVGTFGAVKYTDNGWLSVPDGINRYTDAAWRHYLLEQAGQEVDADSNLLHAAHFAWGSLARLELMLREREGCEEVSATDLTDARSERAMTDQPNDQPCDSSRETDSWRCTTCGRVGTVGRCCGEDTREPVSSNA